MARCDRHSRRPTKRYTDLAGQDHYRALGTKHRQNQIERRKGATVTICSLSSLQYLISLMTQKPERCVEDFIARGSFPNKLTMIPNKKGLPLIMSFSCSAPEAQLALFEAPDGLRLGVSGQQFAIHAFRRVKLAKKAHHPRRREGDCNHHFSFRRDIHIQALIRHWFRGLRMLDRPA